MSNISFIIKKIYKWFYPVIKITFTSKDKKERAKGGRRKKKIGEKEQINKNVTGCCIRSISMLYNNNLVDRLKICG